MIKKIYTILVLIKNLLIRKKHYKLHFVAEVDPPIKRWYYDFKHWGFEHDNLEMVSGADNLCEKYSQGENEVTVEIIASKERLEKYRNTNYDEFVGEKIPKNTKLKNKYLWGRNYTLNKQTKITTMWICPVTLFVLGRYPNFIYIKK